MRAQLGGKATRTTVIDADSGTEVFFAFEKRVDIELDPVPAFDATTVGELGDVFDARVRTSVEPAAGSTTTVGMSEEFARGAVMRLPTYVSYVGASAAAIRQHYDVGKAFYGLWLDESTTYSCGQRAAGDTLEAGQQRKLDYLIEVSGAAGAHRTLDVGCGWGSLLGRLVDEHGVQYVTGPTLSPAQAATALDDPRIEVRVEDWTDHRPVAAYDAIISIGAFEHFARFGLPGVPTTAQQERVRGNRQFFMRCRDLLRPGGRLALQTKRIRDDVDVQLPAGHRLDCAPAGTHAFFTSWRRQEARWKGAACGLAGLENAQLTPPGDYSIVDLPIASGYSAALAVASSTPGVMLRYWTWASS